MKNTALILLIFIFATFLSCSDRAYMKRQLRRANKSAKKGDVSAMTELMYQYSGGHGSNPIDTQKVNYWTKKCAELNDPYCLLQMGHQANDFESKKKYFLKASEYGNPSGDWMIALLYHNKQYNRLMPDSAIKYYIRASNGGLSYATSSLGYIYYFGDGVPKDSVKGLSYFLDAALKFDEPDLSAIQYTIEHYQKTHIPTDTIILKSLQKRKREVEEAYSKRAK